MHIYFYLAGDDLEQSAEPIAEAIAQWLEGNETTAQLVNQQDDQMLVGLTLETGKKAILKEPLNFLYDLAKVHKQEFVVGMLDEQGNREDVCYFGFEEGRPDINEIGEYLGLKR